jgi:SPP1 family holin
MRIDRGTLIRSLALGVTLFNQMLVNYDFDPIPGTSEHWYDIISTIATAAVAIWTWFKNNYITLRGRQQREVLIQNGLAERK